VVAKLSPKSDDYPVKKLLTAFCIVDGKGEDETKKEQEKTDREKGIEGLISNIDQLIKEAEGTPSGIIEGTAATISEKLGYPSDAAKKRARFESGKAIIEHQFDFLKGQESIADSEAKQAMAFLPDPDDIIEIKKIKLEGVKTYLKGLLGEFEEQESVDPVTQELKRRGLTRKIR
jgi:hypothetical protein